MKNVTLFLVSLTFLSCSKQAKIVNLTRSKSEEQRVLFPKKTDNFGQLVSAIDSAACCNFLNPSLKISLEYNQFLPIETNEDCILIRPINLCPNAGVIACFGSSMTFSNKIQYRISDWQDDKLVTQMEDYIFNPNGRSDAVSRPDKALFLFQFEKFTPIEEVLKAVKKVSLAFYEVQQSHPEIELLFLPIFEIPFIPPPPPPNLENL